VNGWEFDKKNQWGLHNNSLYLIEDDCLTCIIHKSNHNEELFDWTLQF